MSKSKKVFGAARGPAPREEFTMTFRDKDEKEVAHDFRTVVRMDAAGLKRALKDMREDPETGLTVMFDVIAGQLDDTDGVPDKWAPIPHRLAPTWPGQPETPTPVYEPIPFPDDDQVREVPESAVFTVPYGPELGRWLTWSRSEEYTTHVAGSSRRRWVDLIDNHDDLAVELDDITALFQWMIGLAANRPT